MGATSLRLTFFDQVVSVTTEYLGPSADRFIARLIRSHLHKSPEQLAKRDLSHLIAWIRLAMAFLSNDDQLVTSYIDKLQQLIERHPAGQSAESRHRNQGVKNVATPRPPA